MPVQNFIFKKLLHSDIFLSLLLLGLFFLLKGYQFGWDDQHLEIPLLKSLIDPSLYPGDYFVESLKKNFVSFFYPLLAKCLKNSDIAPAYFILFTFSRFLLLWAMFKICRHLAADRFLAFGSVTVILTFSKIPEFFYRTFSHQEFALGLSALALYFFYKERFVLAAFLLGLGTNIHALYCLFPMTYIIFYLLFFHPYKKQNDGLEGVSENKNGPNSNAFFGNNGRLRQKILWKNIFKSSSVYVLSALPFLIWAVRIKMAGQGQPEASPDEINNWLAYYKIACPYNFLFNGLSLKDLFKDPGFGLSAVGDYLLLLALLLMNNGFNDLWRRDRKGHAIAAAAGLFLILTYIFSYTWPQRFVLDLNLVRHKQFLTFILLGHSVIFLGKLILQASRPTALLAAFTLCLLSSDGPLAALWVCTLILFFLSQRWQQNSPETGRLENIRLIVWGCIYLALLRFTIQVIPSATQFLSILGLLLGGLYILSHIFTTEKELGTFLRKVWVIGPLTALLLMLGHYHQIYSHYIQNDQKGFWKIQRDFVDMQRFVQAHTPNEALIMIPYDLPLGGFRIFSERKVLCSYQDYGLIGFDYSAAMECFRRLKDIEAFKIMVSQDIRSALAIAIEKYHVDYIVFMFYNQPRPDKNNLFTKIYANTSFALYQVKKVSTP